MTMEHDQQFNPSQYERDQAVHKTWLDPLARIGTHRQETNHSRLILTL